jgi:hypothetical protein
VWTGIAKNRLEAPVDWEAYLTGKGHRGRRATGAEIAYPCFFDCNEPLDSRKRKLYVNADTGLYSCKVCVCEGNGVKLMRHFGDEPEATDMPAIGRRSEVLEEATAVGERTLAGYDDALLYLLGPRRGLSPETVVARRLGYASRQWPLTRQLPEQKKFKQADLEAAGLVYDNGNEYYLDRILIPYIENGRVVQLRGKDIFGRYYTPMGDAVYLYNADSLKGATEAVIVEGEFDCMMLAELLAASDDPRIRNMAVVGLAGTGALPEDFNSRIAHLKRVFIATDPDDPGRKSAEKLVERIGDRAVIMQWPEDLLKRAQADGLELKDIDWTTWIARFDANPQQVAALLRVKGRLATATEALLRFRNRPTNGMKLGFTGLDAAFLPGLLPGQLAIFLAKTGVGKTLILCNLAYNLRKKRVLFITLEMTAEEIWVRLARIYRFYEPFASDDTIAAAYLNLRICDHNRLSEADFERLVEEYTEDVGEKPEIVFVDYLGYYARGRKGGSAYEKASDAVMQLKAEAKKHGLVIITPSQVGRASNEGKPLDTGDARDSGVIEETADLLVAVWRSDDALDANGGLPNGKLHFKILKSRHGNKDRVFLMQMGLMSLVILDDGSPLSERARRESNAVFQGKTYDVWLADTRNHQPELQR